MAKILLINSNRFKHPWSVIPLGLCCIATNLEVNGKHNVCFLDLCFSLNCENDIQKAVQSFTPDMIGISIRNIDDTGGYNTHFLLENVKNDVVDYCKKEFSGPIVIGGPSVGISGREMLEFIKRIENLQPLEGLKGLIIRRDKVPVTWFIMLGARAETKESVLDTLNTIRRVASKWNLVFVSTGVRVYNGYPLAEEIRKHDIHCTSDNFLRSVKIEPEKIGLADIHTIAKHYSFLFPNFYFYEKEHITPGWILIIGNFLLKVSFPSTRLALARTDKLPIPQADGVLIVLFLYMQKQRFVASDGKFTQNRLKRFEWVLGIDLVKRGVFELKMSLFDKKNLNTNGFSLIFQNKLHSKKYRNAESN